MEATQYAGPAFSRSSAFTSTSYDRGIERPGAPFGSYEQHPLSPPFSTTRTHPSITQEEPYYEPDLRRRPSSVSSYQPLEHRARVSPTRSLWGTEYSHDYRELGSEPSPPSATHPHGGPPKPQHGSHSSKPHHTQKRNNRDEFDGPTQYLPRPPLDTFKSNEQDLPRVPVHLDAREQDSVLSEVNTRLSQCAYNFIAKYNFPIPLEAGKRRVEGPQDREWTEWAHLLKRLATKRRIPARLLYDGQIKQMVTILENSLEMRHAAAHQSRPPKDDWNVLQLISAGVQVAKLLKDAETMGVLEGLYRRTEGIVTDRKKRDGSGIWGGER